MSSIEKSVSASDTNGIDNLLNTRSTFRVTNINSSTVTALEKKIENRGLTCRIYTSKRAALLGANLIPGIGQVIGIATAIGIGIHNLVEHFILIYSYSRI